MALKISRNVGLTDIVSDASPLTTTHPVTGSSQEVKVWIFNDNAAYKYEGISIQPTDIVSTNESGWIQLAPDSSGSAGTYGAGGAALSVSNAITANVGTPFWVKVTTPSGQIVQNKNDIKLTVNFTEFAV